MKKYCVLSILGLVLFLKVPDIQRNRQISAMSISRTDTILTSYYNPSDNNLINLGDALCDSIYAEDLKPILFNDTIINGAIYALAIVLSERYTLTFREYSKKWLMYSKMEILTFGSGTKSFDCEDDEVYYELMYPSPNRRYVFYCRYYVTLDLAILREENRNEDRLKFDVGEILDIEEAEIVDYIPHYQLNGDWNYCDQWVVDGEVIFDPNRKTEQ